MSIGVIIKFVGEYSSGIETSVAREIVVMRLISRLNVGGPAYQIRVLEDYLSKTEIKTIVVSGNCASSEREFFEKSSLGSSNHRIEGLGPEVSIFQSFSAFLEIRSLIRKYRPHVLHTHTTKAGILGRLAALTLKKRPKLVHTYHGHLLYGYFGSTFTKVLVFLERALSAKTDVLVAVGMQVKVDLINEGIGKKNKFIVIYPGFEIKVNDENRLNRNMMKLDEATFVITWVGRLTKIKRPDRVVDLAIRLKNKYPMIHFLVAGGGELLLNLQLQKELYKLNNLHLLGWRDDILDLLSITDLMIQTSENEGTPISLIQGQLLGIPAISTDVGSVGDIIEHHVNGYLVSSELDSFESLIETLFLNRDKLLFMSNNAKKLAAAKFDYLNFCLNYSNVYRSLTR